MKRHDRCNILKTGKGNICLLLGLLLCCWLASCSGNTAEEGATETTVTAPPDTATTEVNRLDEFTTSKAYPAAFANESFSAWEQQVPEIQDIRIKSTLDGQEEPALFYDSGSDKPKPLLVMLHSWSSEYLQEVSIPFALWAKQHDWVFIHPNFRGPFNRPEAMASELAIQDIIDAVDYAKEKANVDPSRVYILGSSGGAMTALVAAGKRPDIWAGVVAWVPVLDLVDWYEFNLLYPHREYNANIVAACGGEPLAATPAEEECKKRSPGTYMPQLRDVPIFLAHGIADELVPADHSLRAFNKLVPARDRFSRQQMEYIVKEKKLPAGLKGPNKSPYFGGDDPEVVFSRESGHVKLVLFDGVHDMAYNPGLLWLYEQQRK